MDSNLQITPHSTKALFNNLNNNTMIKIAQKLKDHLWWLIISVDYDYSRIAIADHDLTDDTLTLWLEDKQDYKNSLDECLQVDIKAREFAKINKGRGA